MPTIDDGGPAFPFIGTVPATGLDSPMPQNVFHVGMSLRDWFAGQALIGILSMNPILEDERDGTAEVGDEFRLTAVDEAFEYADAMLAARKKGGA